jgi:hypothetical protein
MLSRRLREAGQPCALKRVVHCSEAFVAQPWLGANSLVMLHATRTLHVLTGFHVFARRAYPSAKGATFNARMAQVRRWWVNVGPKRREDLQRLALRERRTKPKPIPYSSIEPTAWQKFIRDNYHRVRNTANLGDRIKILGYLYSKKGR